jgi:hypothetical protein
VVFSRRLGKTSEHFAIVAVSAFGVARSEPGAGEEERLTRRACAVHGLSLFEGGDRLGVAPGEEQDVRKVVVSEDELRIGRERGGKRLRSKSALLAETSQIGDERRVLGVEGDRALEGEDAPRSP